MRGELEFRLTPVPTTARIATLSWLRARSRYSATYPHVLSERRTNRSFPYFRATFRV